MTRARDHLVVSVHRPAKRAGRRPHHVDARRSCSGTPRPTRRSGRRSPPIGRRRAARGDARRSTAPGRAPPPWAEWRRERDDALARGGPPRASGPPPRSRGRPPSRGGRRADPGLAKGARDLELPPWNKGRYGTALGRAVHAVLQTVDLATGDGLDDTAAAQAAAEGDHRARGRGRGARAGRARRRARCAEAVAHGFRREMYVATPVDGTTLEGYVDLVYRATRRPRRRRLQDRRVARRRRPRRQGRALPAPGRVVRGGARAGDRRAGRRVRVPVPRRARRAASGRSAICRRRCARYEQLLAASGCSRHHTSTPPIGPVSTTSAV